MPFFFFFQAEDGIRDLTVTGVQTCALPISITTTASRPTTRKWMDISPRWPRRCRSEEHTSELQSQSNLVCRLLLEKKKKKKQGIHLVIDNVMRGLRRVVQRSSCIRSAVPGR